MSTRLDRTSKLSKAAKTEELKNMMARGKSVRAETSPRNVGENIPRKEKTVKQGSIIFLSTFLCIYLSSTHGL